MSKVEGRGPIDPPLCPLVTFFTLCLLELRKNTLSYHEYSSFEYVRFFNKLRFIGIFRLIFDQGPEGMF